MQRVAITGIEQDSHDGVIVVLDVCRAFTTAAVAFSRGATEIMCVEDLDAAFALAATIPGSLLMGEERGVRPEGFDFGNSPFDVAELDLTGRRLVQRTTNGTRGLAVGEAPVVLVAGAANASVTARYIRARHGAKPVRIVCTGETDEDWACAEFIANLVRGREADARALAARILASAPVHRKLWSHHQEPNVVDSFMADLAYCAEVDRFDFAMVGERKTEGERRQGVVALCSAPI